jgi:biotin carboxylase
VHPGYGFLSESAEFVDMCEEAGIAFLGPKSDTMRLFSRKHDARAFAENAKVPILAGEQAQSQPQCSCCMLCLGFWHTKDLQKRNERHMTCFHAKQLDTL